MRDDYDFFMIKVGESYVSFLTNSLEKDEFKEGTIVQESNVGMTDDTLNAMKWPSIGNSTFIWAFVCLKNLFKESAKVTAVGCYSEKGIKKLDNLGELFTIIPIE